MPYTAHWGSAVNVQDVVQIVDGKWVLGNDTGVGPVNSVRTQQIGYDRLFVIGDISWDNYEVLIPITVHSLEAACFVNPELKPCEDEVTAIANYIDEMVNILNRLLAHHLNFGQRSQVEQKNSL